MRNRVGKHEIRTRKGKSRPRTEEVSHCQTDQCGWDMINIGKLASGERKRKAWAHSNLW